MVESASLKVINLFRCDIWGHGGLGSVNGGTWWSWRSFPSLVTLVTVFFGWWFRMETSDRILIKLLIPYKNSTEIESNVVIQLCTKDCSADLETDYWCAVVSSKITCCLMLSSRKIRCRYYALYSGQGWGYWSCTAFTVAFCSWKHEIFLMMDFKNKGIL